MTATAVGVVVSILWTLVFARALSSGAHLADLAAWLGIGWLVLCGFDILT